MFCLAGELRHASYECYYTYALDRRSLTLRAYGGDTSLPGGKMEPTDRSIEDTAVSLYLRHISAPFIYFAAKGSL